MIIPLAVKQIIEQARLLGKLDWVIRTEKECKYDIEEIYECRLYKEVEQENMSYVLTKCPNLQKKLDRGGWRTESWRKS